MWGIRAENTQPSHRSRSPHSHRAHACPRSQRNVTSWLRAAVGGLLVFTVPPGGKHRKAASLLVQKNSRGRQQSVSCSCWDLCPHSWGVGTDSGSHLSVTYQISFRVDVWWSQTGETTSQQALLLKAISAVSTLLLWCVRDDCLRRDWKLCTLQRPSADSRSHAVVFVITWITTTEISDQLSDFCGHVKGSGQTDSGHHF